MNYEQRTNKGFTLIELAVAVGILTVVLAFASVIFKVSIGTSRTAMANAEVMQKLRAITEQLNADFKGLRKDTPLLIWFRQEPNDPNNRYDQIMFFANGDFQSTQLYSKTTEMPDPAGDKFVMGNVARIHYSQAQSLDPDDNIIKEPFDIEDEKARLLGRRQHILTADQYVDIWPDANTSNFNTSFKEKTGGVYKNEIYEHDSLPLSYWKIVERREYKDTDEIIDICFGYRPWVDKDDPDTYHKLMCEGVGNFAIQWAYWNSDDTNPNDDKLCWYPSDDPLGDGSVDSHFTLINEDKFGVFFNIPGSAPISDWYPIGDTKIEYRPGDEFTSVFYPDAIKFTFTLYDSKGIIEKSRRFTHIVYLEK